MCHDDGHPRGLRNRRTDRPSVILAADHHQLRGLGLLDQLGRRFVGTDELDAPPQRLPAGEQSGTIGRSRAVDAEHHVTRG
ncbi:hypothetical protein [Mycobacterium sp.]|uniref:hypothetical protein n=1 Tax=Mycobacterium sp. TaxID=1785 RepID=UPI0031E2FC26